MCEGLVRKSEMLKFRKMVVELNDNLDKVVLTSDKERVGRYVRTKRRFTQGEAMTILDLHYKLKLELEKRKAVMPNAV